MNEIKSKISNKKAQVSVSKQAILKFISTLYLHYFGKGKYKINTKKSAHTICYDIIMKKHGLK